ncbi:hypothetical protein B7486_59040, partial [cyanobacterium TDX16]
MRSIGRAYVGPVARASAPDRPAPSGYHRTNEAAAASLHDEGTSGVDHDPGQAATSEGATPVALGLPTTRRTARVALIRPNTIVLPKSFSWYGPVPPIGLAYISSVLREAGHDVTVIDSAGEGIDRWVDFESPVGLLRRCGLPIEEILDRIPADVQLVGVTHMFVHEWPHIRELIGAVRERFPDATIVAGGENATAFWPWMFEDSDAIDACVLGEGET